MKGLEAAWPLKLLITPSPQVHRELPLSLQPRRAQRWCASQNIEDLRGGPVWTHTTSLEESDPES